jgi:hypothetical protein
MDSEDCVPEVSDENRDAIWELDYRPCVMFYKEIIYIFSMPQDFE